MYTSDIGVIATDDNCLEYDTVTQCCKLFIKYGLHRGEHAVVGSD